MSMAVVVILLHSIIAHEHKTDMAEEDHLSAHSCAVTLFDNFALGFHLDSGEGHLEHFVTSNTDFDQAVSSLVLEYTDNYPVTLGRLHSVVSPVEVCLDPHYFCLTLRGPPLA